jgi:hypothetical protein
VSGSSKDVAKNCLWIQESLRTFSSPSHTHIQSVNWASPSSLVFFLKRHKGAVCTKTRSPTCEVLLTSCKMHNKVFAAYSSRSLGQQLFPNTYVNCSALLGKARPRGTRASAPSVGRKSLVLTHHRISRHEHSKKVPVLRQSVRLCIGDSNYPMIARGRHGVDVLHSFSHL